MGTFYNDPAKEELEVWELMTQHNHNKLPNFAKAYVNLLANETINQFGTNGSRKFYHGKTINSWILNGGWAIPLLEDIVDIQEGLDSSLEKVSNVSIKYVSAVQKFRSEIKNDVSSIAASASKQVIEIDKLCKAISNLKESMTSEQMVTALNNAERLAKALEAISALQSHSITFAVLDKK
jgi:hypothetical protein